MVIIMNDKLITLITVLSEKRDSSGFKTGEDTHCVEIFAEEKSVGRAEHYEARRSAMEVSIILSVNPEDFLLSVAEITLRDGKTKKVKASKVEYEGTQYQIIRTYKTKAGMLEMTCKEIE